MTHLTLSTISIAMADLKATEERIRGSGGVVSVKVPPSLCDELIRIYRLNESPVADKQLNIGSSISWWITAPR